MDFGNLLRILNGLGLPVIGVALLLLYRTLVHRAELLQKTVDDVKGAYGNILEIAQHRASEFERSLDDQKKFNELYLKIAADTEAHKEKIKDWMNGDILLLEKKVAKLSDELLQAQTQHQALADENRNLKLRMRDLEKEHEWLKEQLKQVAGGFTINK